MNTILIIDSDAEFGEKLKTFLEEQGFHAESARKFDDGWEKFLTTKPFVVIVEQLLPDGQGIDMLRRIKETAPQTYVILTTRNGKIRDAVQAMEMGAINYLTKPLDMNDLRDSINKAQNLGLTTQAQEKHHDMKSTMAENSNIPLPPYSKIMKEVFRRCQEIAATDTTVLLCGENGVGKCLFAHYIYRLSSRADGPFIEVDCAAIPETLLESELFGYELGSFAEAKGKKSGLIELAHNGTLFFDEISCLPIVLQNKLSKTIEEKSFRKLGGSQDIAVNTRIIAATKNDLKQLVKEGRFKENLYYQISTCTIEIPPLRQRKEDIVPLARHFLTKFSKELHKEINDFEIEVLDALVNYGWPGNIRELRNMIEKAVITTKNRLITIDDIGTEFSPPAPEETKVLFYRDAKQQFESEILEAALTQARGNQSKAARLLGVSRNALFRRLRKYRIDSRKFKKK